MDFVFAADVDTAKTDKTSFPDFPGENPPQADMLKWLDAWHDDLVTSGFSAHLRGELPFELAKLKPRELLPDVEEVEMEAGDEDLSSEGSEESEDED